MPNATCCSPSIASRTSRRAFAITFTIAGWSARRRPCVTCCSAIASPIKLASPSFDLPLLFHWGRQDNAVGFYGCKITPEDIQHVILRVPELAAKVANFALHPFEDADANKRLELWLELEEAVTIPANSAGMDADVWRELASVNQDFRESINMIPGERRPKLR